MVTETVHRLWNGACTPHPARVVPCRSTAEVQAAVRAARADDLPLSVLGGGHDWAGRAMRDGAVVLDLAGLRAVEIRADERVAVVGGGATASDVLDQALPHGLAAVLGTVGSVGVAGLLLGGGLSTLSGVAGLGADNLLAAEVVLADGRVVRADEESEPELFWALRGGGGNFGVVTRVELGLHEHAQVATGMIAFPWSEGREVLRKWHAVASLDDRLDVMFGAMTTPAGLVLFTTPMWLGDPDEDQAWLDQVRALGTPVLDQVARIPLAEAVHAIDELCPAGGNYHGSTRTLPVPDAAALETLAALVEAMPPTGYLNVHHLHGAALAPAVGATAYAYREEHLVVELLGFWGEGDGADVKAWVARAEEMLEPHALPGGWPALMRPDDPRARDAYGPNTERLLAAKKHYDPDGVFVAGPLPARD